MILFLTLGIFFYLFQIVLTLVAFFDQENKPFKKKSTFIFWLLPIAPYYWFIKGWIIFLKEIFELIIFYLKEIPNISKRFKMIWNNLK